MNISKMKDLVCAEVCARVCVCVYRINILQINKNNGIQNRLYINQHIPTKKNNKSTLKINTIDKP